MSRRTQNRNQYESGTTGELAAGAFSVTVDSAAGLITDEPMYLVIEPDIPGQREWILIVSITGNQLNIANPNGRNLTGSDGDLTHPAGSKVRSMPTQQIFEDIFQDAEDDELALTTHIVDGTDPHQQAGYLTVAETDPLYVNIVGDTMTGLLILSADPTAAFGASTKQYTDAAQQAAQDFATGLDHDHATPIAAALTNYLQLAGGTMLGSIDFGGFDTTNVAILRGVTTGLLALRAGLGQDVRIQSALVGSGENQGMRIHPGTTDIVIEFNRVSGAVSLSFDNTLNRWDFENTPTGLLLLAGASATIYGTTPDLSGVVESLSDRIEALENP